MQNIITPTVSLSQEVNNVCRKFSEDVVSTVNYSNRGQNDKSKIATDFYKGKMAEFAVYTYLKNIYTSVSVPDISIYEQNRKLHDADIIADGNHFHIKTSYSERFKNTWIVQYFPNPSPLINRNALGYFVGCNILGMAVEIACIKKVSNLIFSLPDLERLHATKRAIRLEDMDGAYYDI